MTRTHPVWRLAKIIAGLSLLVLGVVGLFLPILQGVLFLFLGLTLLATENRQAHEVVQALKRRHPGPWKQAERLRRWLAGYASHVRTKSEKPSEDEASGDEGSSRETT
jgi:hypothetical protein